MNAYVDISEYTARFDCPDSTHAVPGALEKRADCMLIGWDKKLNIPLPTGKGK
jgi:hypothetical protein